MKLSGKIFARCEGIWNDSTNKMEMQLAFWMSPLSIIVFELFHVFIHHMMTLSKQQKIHISVTSVVEKQNIFQYGLMPRGEFINKKKVMLLPNGWSYKLTPIKLT